MAYATVAGMIGHFGEAEMIRLSTPDGAAMVAVIAEPIETALDDASAIIDIWLRRRYRVPLSVCPPELRRACCILARYDLSTGEQKNPSEQTLADRTDTLKWLAAIGAGTAPLDLEEVAVSDQSYAITTSRSAVYGADSLGGSYFDPQQSGFWTGGA